MSGHVEDIYTYTKTKGTKLKEKKYGEILTHPEEVSCKIQPLHCPHTPTCSTSLKTKGTTETIQQCVMQPTSETDILL